MIEDVSDSDSGLPLSKRKRRLIRNMATATSSEIISSILSKSESQDVNAGVAAAAAVVDEEVEEEDEVLTDWELTLDPAPTVTTAATVARICSKKSVIILLPKTCALVLQARRIVREYLESKRKKKRKIQEGGGGSYDKSSAVEGGSVASSSTCETAHSHLHNNKNKENTKKRRISSCSSDEDDKEHRQRDIEIHQRSHIQPAVSAVKPSHHNIRERSHVSTSSSWYTPASSSSSLSSTTAAHSNYWGGGGGNRSGLNTIITTISSSLPSTNIYAAPGRYSNRRPSPPPPSASSINSFIGYSCTSSSPPPPPPPLATPPLPQHHQYQYQLYQQYQQQQHHQIQISSSPLIYPQSTSPPPALPSTNAYISKYTSINNNRYKRVIHDHDDEADDTPIFAPWSQTDSVAMNATATSSSSPLKLSDDMVDAFLEDIHTQVTSTRDNNNNTTSSSMNHSGGGVVTRNSRSLAFLPLAVVQLIFRFVGSLNDFKALRLVCRATSVPLHEFADSARMFVIAATHGQRDLLVRLLSNPGLKGVRCAVLYTPPHNPGAINSATNTIPPADADTVSIPDQRSAFVLSTAILNAARNGHDRIIEILLGIIPIPPPPPPPNHLINTPLPLIPPSPAVTSANINNKSRMTAAMLDLGGEVLKIACRNGHLDLVGVLLDDGRVDVSFQDQIAVRYACAKGHTRVLQRLLLDPRVDAASQDNEPLRTAAKDGAVSILTALLAHARTSGIDPSACENMAVRDASRKGHVECVALLVGDPRFSAQVELYGAGFVDRMVHNAAVARKKLGKRKVYARLAGDVGSGMIGDHHEHGGDEKIYHHQANRRSSSISATSDANGSTYKSNSHRNSMNYIDIGGDNDVMRDLDSSHPRSLRSATTSTDVAVLDDSAMDIDMMAVDKMQDGKTLFDQPPDKMAEFEEAYVKGNSKKVYLLLQDPAVDPAADENKAICTAARLGHVDIVRHLLMDFRVDVAACDFSCARAAAVGGHVKILKEIMSSCPSLARDKRLCEMLIREAESVNSGDGGAGAYPETPAAPAASKTTTTGRLIQAPPSSATSSTSNSNGPLQTQPLQVPSLPQHSKPRISSSFSSLSSSSSSSFSGPLPVQTAAEKKEAFQEAYTNGNVKIAYELINDPSIDPSVNDNLALCTASSQGHIDIARLLLLDFRVEVTDKAIACAAKGGHVKLVKELFASPTFKMSKDKRYCERVLRETQAVRDGLNHKVLLNGVSVTPTTLTMPKSSLSTAVPTFPPPSPQPSRSLKKEEFQSAYTRGDAKSIYRLLQDPDIDPSADQNAAIRTAAREGFIDVVRHLLMDWRVNVSDCNNQAVTDAASRGNVNIVKVIIASPSFDLAKDKLFCESMVNQAETVKKGKVVGAGAVPVANTSAATTSLSSTNTGVRKVVAAGSTIPTSNKNYSSNDTSFINPDRIRLLQKAEEEDLEHSKEDGELSSGPSSPPAFVLPSFLNSANAIPVKKKINNASRSSVSSSYSLDISNTKSDSKKTHVSFSSTASTSSSFKSTNTKSRRNKKLSSSVPVIPVSGIHPDHLRMLEEGDEEEHDDDSLLDQRDTDPDERKLKKSQVLPGFLTSTNVIPLGTRKSFSKSDGGGVVGASLIKAAKSEVSAGSGGVTGSTTSCFSIAGRSSASKSTLEKQKLLFEACEKGESGQVYKLLQDTSLDPSFDDNIAFRTASRIGHTDVVRLLLLDFRVNASANDNEAITEASKGGHVNIVRDITSNASFDRKFDRRFCDKLLNEAIKIKKSASKGSEIK